MARRATGRIIEKQGRDGLVYRSLRFSAYGVRRYEALGPVSRADAERALRGVLADIEGGTWKPRTTEVPASARPAPTFLEFTETWWVEHEREWRENTRRRYRECLEIHLLPFFGQTALDRIAIADVDRYKAVKLRDGKLAPATINKTLVLLSSILEAAEERELIPRNVARGRRRRVRAAKPPRSYLDTAEQIEVLLDAAAQLDSEARSDRRHVNRRELLATLIFAGLRLGELLDLRWRDVDLAVGRLRVGEAKTEAGRRDVTLRPALRDLLASLKAASDVEPDAYVFGTSNGRHQGATNIRKRVMGPAVTRANKLLAERGENPLPDRLTPHSLRRTFASVLYAIGENPPTVMAEMGHASPTLALAIYAQAMRRGEDERERLRALIDGAQLAVIGSRDDFDVARRSQAKPSEHEKTPR